MFNLGRYGDFAILRPRRVVSAAQQTETRMSRNVQIFRQTDVVKAIRAAQNAGLAVQQFEIDRAGKIIVIATKLKVEGSTDYPCAMAWPPDVDAANRARAAV
jgi:hypothetical protein